MSKNTLMVSALLFLLVGILALAGCTAQAQQPGEAVYGCEAEAAYAADLVVALESRLAAQFDMSAVEEEVMSVLGDLDQCVDR